MATKKLDLMTRLPICLPFMQQSQCDYTHATVRSSAWQLCDKSLGAAYLSAVYVALAALHFVLYYSDVLDIRVHF